jgi:hypothetical protein
MRRPKTTELLSDKLSGLLSRPGKLYISSIDEIFGAKSFAVAIVLLMAFPSLPIPTGGISHVFEIATMIIALQIIAGRKNLWLPKRMLSLGLSETVKKKALPFMVKRLKFVEHHSRPRGSRYYKIEWFRRGLGIPILVLTVLAFTSIPFSGLDTLYAIGTVIVALSLLLEDIALLIIGVASGIAGVVVSIYFGTVLVNFFQGLFH